MPQSPVSAALAAGYTPDQIIQHLQTGDNPLTPKVQAAVKAGYSPQEIVQHLDPTYTPPAQGSDSGLAALETGGGQAIGGLANLAGDAAGALGFKGAAASAYAKARALQNAGGFNGHPIDNLRADVSNVMQGKNVLQNVENAGGSLGNLALTQLPQMGTALGLSAIASPAAGAAYLGANAAGNTIQTRMDAKGEAAPTGGDYAAGALNGAVQGVVGETGLGKVVPGLAGATAKAGVIPAIEAAGSRTFIPRLAAGTALAGGAGAITGAANNVADTAGIGNGPTLAGVGNAAVTGALEGAGARAATLLPGAGLRAVKGAQEGSVLTQASQARVDGMLETIGRQMQDAGVKPTQAQAVDTTMGQLKAHLQAVGKQAVVAGHMAPSDLTNTLNPLIAQATSRNGVVGENGDSAQAGDPQTLLSRLQATGLPDDYKGPMVNAAKDLETLAQIKYFKPSEGTAETAGKFVGKFAGAGAARLLASHLMPEGAGFPGASLGEDIAGYALGDKVFGGLGRAIDTARGHGQAPASRNAILAAQNLQSLGISPGENSITSLQKILATPPTPPTPPAAEPEPPDMGQAAAATKLASTIRQYGPGDPRSKAAITQLQAMNQPEAISAALNYHSLTSPVAAEAARLAQAKATNAQAVKDQASTAKSATASRGADVAAAFAVSPGEALMNRTAARHQAILDAENLVPTPPQPDDDANYAAMAEMERKANATRNLANGGGTPTAAGASPPAASDPASPAPAAEPPPAAVSTPMPAPASPAIPNDLYGHPLGSLGNKLAVDALTQARTPLSPSDLTGAIGRMTASGQLDPQIGAYLEHSMGQPLNNAAQAFTPHLTAILNEALAAKGAADPISYQSGRGSSGGPAVPNGGSRPVKNLYQYNSVASTIQHQAGELANLASSSGDPFLAAKIREIAMTPDVKDKTALRDDYIKSLGGDIKARARARALIPDVFVNTGRK